VRGEFERCKVELQKSNQEATRLEAELKAETDSLRDCPQVVMRLGESRIQSNERWVAVYNASKTVDAFDIEMDPVDGHDVRLVAKRIDYLRAAGEAKELQLSAARIRKRASLPELPETSEARVFFEELADKTPFSCVNVTVRYRDATSKKRCTSTGRITWYVLPHNKLASVEFDKVSRA
jgi:chorismate mutase